MIHHGWNRTTYVPVCSPHIFPPMANAIYGFIIPFLAIVTFCANTLAILVFMTTNRKSPTNLNLTVLAFSNMVSIGSISPMFFLVYGLQKSDVFYKCSFMMYHDASYFTTSLFHCFSIWLTVLLGVERFIVVWFPINGPHFCNLRNTLLAIVFMFLASFLVMIVPNIWSKHYFPVVLNVSRNDYEGTINADSNDTYVEMEMCHCTYEPFELRFHYAYNWMRNILGTTVPCLILVVTTILLILELRKNNRKIRELHFADNASERREQKCMKRASKLVIVITAFFVITELPNAIFFTWIIVEPHAYDSELDTNARFTSSIICNLFVYFACTANFFILLLMSNFFRRKLKYFLFLACIQKKPKKKHKRFSYSFSTTRSSLV